MKALMILGALIGFLIGSSSGLTGQSSWSTALWRGSAAALVAAVLTRWWTGVWIEGLRESLAQRHHTPPPLPPNPKPSTKV